MKLPTLDTRSLLPALEAFVAAGRSRELERLSSRERATEIGRLVFLALAVIGIAVIDGGGGSLDLGVALAFTAAYAVAALVHFEVGAGLMVPTQLIFIPMLLLMPPWAVPLAVGAGTLLSSLPNLVSGRIHPDRLLLDFPNAWYAVGPAIVMALTNPGAPSWNDAPIYLLIFAAQIVSDVTATTIREWLVFRVSPGLQVAVLARIYMVDALLTPVGIVAAMAAGSEPYRALLVIPLIALLAVFAQERAQHLEHAIELSNAYRGTALLLGDVLEDKDAYTASHSHGVVSLSLAVSDRMRLDPAARRRVEFGALLHDIGKIAVPAEIINKPGPLDDEEWSVMKLHTVEGQQMLDRVGGVLGEVGRVVRSSHEHYDGSGYPDGLRGSAIPIEARIVTCCDAFSAMTTTRSYRKAMSLDAAKEELLRNRGTQFDPDVVDALLEVIREENVVPSASVVDSEAPAPAHSHP